MLPSTACCNAQAHYSDVKAETAMQHGVLNHLVAQVVACGVDLVQLGPPLLINANDDGHHSERPHVCMLHIPQAESTKKQQAHSSI